MPNYTSNYNLSKPLVNDPTDEDLWGAELNDDMDDIDTLLKQGITITPQSSQTTGFTAASTISIKYIYPCDATSAAFAATLPTAAAAGSGATVYFKKTDSSSNAITITRASSDTIDGATTYVLSSQYQVAGLVSDGVSKWNVITSITPPDASTTVKGIIEIATAAEVTTGTDSVRAVVPSTVKASPGVAKAWATFDGTASSPITALDSYNISGIVKNSTGDYTVTFTTAFANAYYCVQIGAQITSGGSALGASNVTTQSTTSCRFVTRNNGAAPTDFPMVYVVFHGTQ